MAESLLHGKRFYCREWAFMKLSHCLEQRHASKAGGALILGGAGCGKTALCSELVWPSVITSQGGYRQRSLNRRLLAYHFCQAHDVSSLSPADFVRHLVQQLRTSELLAPHFEEKLKDPEILNALRPEICERDPDEAFKKSVLFPLLELDPPKQCCYILVDSIDETNVSGPGEKLERGGSCGSAGSFSISGRSKTILELLANHHQLLPQWLLLICTARRYNRGMARMFAGFRKLSLDEVRKTNVVKDVQQYILARLDSEPALRAHMGRDDTAEMLNQLHIKSHGCLLYAERVLDAVSAGSIVLREIREIPGTLNGLYLWLCQRLFTRKQFTRIQPLINSILAARLPLTEIELFGCLRAFQSTITKDDFNKRLNILKRVLVERNGTYLLFHHSFAEWLVDVKHCTQKYLCKTLEGHSLIAKSLSNRGPELCSEDIHTLASHLVRLEGIQNAESGDGTTTTTLDRHLLALWLVLSDTQVEDCLRNSESSPKDQRALRLLIEAGAKQRVNELDELQQTVSEESSPVESDIDPLAELLRATASGLGQDCEGAGESLTLGGSNSGGSLLHALCTEGSARLVALLLARGGVDIESPDRNGQTALNLAARHGHADIVSLLLEAGAEPDHADADGWTALRSAAWGGHVAAVEVLLHRGADVERADAEGRTALRAAAWGGHEEIVLLLLRAGAQVDGADAEGRTPLIAAAYMSHAEIVEHLLEFGADPDHEDSDGRTALSVAALCVPASEGYTKVANILLEKGASVDHEDRDGMTPLLVAAFEGHREVCELLLEYEADPEHADKGGRSPLWAAASMGHCGVVALLLFWGCSVDGIDNEGRTVLSVAAAQGSARVARLLLDRGLDEMHRDNAGWTPLHYSSFEGHLGVCEALLDAGAKVDETDNDGKTALMLASQEGHAPVVALLITRGANTNHRAHDGKTALRLAALEGHREVVRTLMRAGADPSAKDADGRSTLYVLALENRVSIARFLIAEAASLTPPPPPPRGGIVVGAPSPPVPLLLDLEGADSEGRTPLHVSAWQGHTEMAALLLDAGADVNATDREKRTALQSASWQGHAGIVRLLLCRDARVDHTCSQGATALCIAAQEGHAPCVRALLSGGADPNHSDRSGRTALRVAAKSGHEEVVRLLEEAAATGAIMRLKHGGGSSNASVASTTETKPSSAVLLPPSYRSASPPAGGSPDSTTDLKRRSYVSVGNQSSSKSSSNFTGSSTKSTQGITVMQPTQNSTDHLLSFTQQLQRASKHRPLSKVLLLSPLSEPHSPIYASPPQSPLSDTSLRNSPPLLPNGGTRINNFIDSNHQRQTFAQSTAINSPFPETLKNSTAPLSFTQDSHMRIILGNRIPESSSKLKRNGIVTNPNLKTTSVAGGIKSGLKNGLEAARKQVTSKCQKANGFPWKKETPL